MKVSNIGSFLAGTLEDVLLPDKDYKKLMAMANEDYSEELSEMLEEAQSVANPIVLFGVCSISKTDAQTVCVNEISIHSALAVEKLSNKKRCFPYIASCGRALEIWSEKYSDDILAKYWADEIKKYYVGRIAAEYYAHLKKQYHPGGHLTALNPGSISAWPISGQKELFDIFGGKAIVKEQIGVTYTPSYLMLPSKSVSGIAFESEVFYENCQFCPLEHCPGRRAMKITTP